MTVMDACVTSVGLVGQFPSKNVNGKRQLRRCRLGWEDSSKMDLNETGYERVDCIHLPGEDTVAGSCEHGN
jgi:hypothetical protein